ncbi:MAG: PEP-CTERM sorting domain-containing protein [Acidobacteriota bacterium]|nr:PEP-CTERM sorting domain-containing protein [Acidobacteriota bacterium]
MKYFIGLCFLTCSVVPSFGTTISFATPAGYQGTSHSYGGITATAYGAGTQYLYGKNNGGNENGLGLTSDPSGDHEITVGQFIQLDVTSLQGLTISFIMNSSTGSEAWKVFESSSPSANSGSSTVTGTDQGSHSITIASGMKYLDFTATAGNVLLSSISYTATPEPLSLGLTGAGLVGLFLLRRRKAGSPDIN